MSSLKHECGVFGVIGSRHCFADCMVGQNAQQFRGEEWNGYAIFLDGKIYILKYPGLVSDNPAAKLRDAPEGELAISHIRYCTQGASTYENAQPHLSRDGQTALCSNGDLPIRHYRKWRKLVTKKGFEPISDNDGELLLRIIEWRLSEGDDIIAALQFLQRKVVGAFSALVIHQGRLLAFRDRKGFRPLVFGTKSPGMLYIASETCALDDLGVDSWQVVAPGEILSVNPDGSYQQYRLPRIKHAHCVFCNIYFGGPNSVIFRIANSLFRKKQGQYLARTIPPNADIVVPVPDSGNCAALGLANASGVPLDFGLIRRHYNMGRSFTAPTQELRDRIVNSKLVAVRAIVEGKIVVLVDDSIVRGTTMKRVVEKLFRAGAKEVHVRITAPIITHPCFYGIDTPKKSKLVGSHLTVEQICKKIGATSLVYSELSDLDKVIRSFNRDPNNYCKACFTGHYPTSL